MRSFREGKQGIGMVVRSILARMLEGKNSVGDGSMNVIFGAIMMISFGVNMDKRKDNEPDRDPRVQDATQPRPSDYV